MDTSFIRQQATGDEEKPPSPCELIEANANITSERGWASYCVSRPPRLWGRLLLL
jgi:hypothetical protein